MRDITNIKTVEVNGIGKEFCLLKNGDKFKLFNSKGENLGTFMANSDAFQEINGSWSVFFKYTTWEGCK